MYVLLSRSSIHSIYYFTYYDLLCYLQRYHPHQPHGWIIWCSPKSSSLYWNPCPMPTSCLASLHTRVPDPPSQSASAGPSQCTPCAPPFLHHHLTYLTSSLYPLVSPMETSPLTAFQCIYLVTHQVNALFWKAKINALQLGDEQNGSVWQEHLGRGTNQREELCWELRTHLATGRRKKSCND